MEILLAPARTTRRSRWRQVMHAIEHEKEAMVAHNALELTSQAS